MEKRPAIDAEARGVTTFPSMLTGCGGPAAGTEPRAARGHVTGSRRRGTAGARARRMRGQTVHEAAFFALRGRG